MSSSSPHLTEPDGDMPQWSRCITRSGKRFRHDNNDATEETNPKSARKESCTAAQQTGEEYEQEFGRDCRKFHRHDSEYFSPEELSIDSLPKNLQTELIMDTIKKLAKLIVYIKTGFVSKDNPYEHSKPFRGLPIQNDGSGWIEGVKYDSRRQQHYARIVTAKHVVFDHTEMDHATIHLDWGGHTRQMKATTILGGNVKSDRNVLFHYINDEDFAKELEFACSDKNECLKKINDSQRFGSELKGTVVVMGYPHRDSVGKKISFGNIKQGPKYSGHGLVFYEHTALTCPGVSGGMTWLVGHSSGPWYYLAAPHKWANKSGFAETGAIEVQLTPTKQRHTGRYQTGHQTGHQKKLF